MSPKLDGSHDNIPDLHTGSHARTQKAMEDRLRPLVEQLVAEEGEEGFQAVIIECAEKLEPHLRIHAPDHPLLALLDDHREKTQGFC
jgi:hypothetical protein